MDDVPAGSGRRVCDGRFELRERLGSGAMGTVWRALDTTLHREVALKEVRAPEGASAEEAETIRARALREARALARLRNPHVVAIHQVADDEPFPWIVMELVPGRTLAAVLADGPLDPRTAAGLGADLLDALTAAHGAGVLHRDVKPANVLVRPDGRAVLVDFGIAAVEGTAAVTTTGSFIGTLEYAAPERTAGGEPSPATDLWSLGVLLCTAVEGRNPFRRANEWATLGAIVNEPHPPPQHAGALTPVIDALLTKDPAQRPDAATVAAGLAAARQQADVPTLHAALSTAPAAHASTTGPEPSTDADLPTVPARPAPAAPSPSGRAPRRKRALLVGALVAALLAGGGVAAWTLTDGSGDGGKKTPQAGPTTPAAPGSTAPSAPALPAGYELRTHGTGFQVAVPAGWTEAADKSGSPVYESPDRTARLTVRVLPGNSADPYAEQQKSQRETAASPSYPGYVNVGLTQGIQSGGTSATWEYTYTPADGKRRIKDVRWRIGTTGYNLWMSAPDGRSWPQHAQHLDVALAHFKDTARR
ncbi:serine/threonine-protein kinase [Yinghuangia soli]|uniref:non-specific serine/threonine protein kinase n=1 Tax=Yinghuangia soli TaxID=2908204 RepID=A0AA41Q2F7_9ACTN|nr:serine/threonine-protein kinase [Yinghuangia soli]MCF2530081.1 serine/threonine protein kinase [Yinghuangia soli]